MKLSRAAIAAIAAVLLVPTASQAGTASHYDTTTDLLRLTLDPEGDPTSIGPVPSRKYGDITKAKAAFSGETIRLSASYRVLVKQGDAVFHTFRIVTSKTERHVDVSRIVGAAPSWTGVSALTKWDGNPVPCPGLTHRIDYTAMVVTVTLPRTCLAVNKVKPGAFRFGVGFAEFEGDHLYVDDAFKDGVVSDQDALTLSPTITR